MILLQLSLIFSVLIVALAERDFTPPRYFFDFKSLLVSRAVKYEQNESIPSSVLLPLMNEFIYFHPTYTAILKILSEDVGTFEPLTNLISKHFKRPYPLDSIFELGKWKRAMEDSIKTLSVEDPQLLELLINHNLAAKKGSSLPYPFKSDCLSKFKNLNECFEHILVKDLLQKLRFMNDNVQGNQRFLYIITTFNNIDQAVRIWTRESEPHSTLIIYAASFDLEATLKDVISVGEDRSLFDMAKRVYESFRERKILKYLLAKTFKYWMNPFIECEYEDLLDQYYELADLNNFKGAIDGIFNPNISEEFPPLMKHVINSIWKSADTLEKEEFLLFSSVSFFNLNPFVWDPSIRKLLWSSFIYTICCEFSAQFPLKVEILFPGMTADILKLNLLDELNIVAVSVTMPAKLHYLALWGHWKSFEVIRHMAPNNFFYHLEFHGDKKLFYLPEFFIPYLDFVKTLQIPRIYQEKYLLKISATGNLECFKYFLEITGTSFSENARNMAFANSVNWANIEILNHMLSIPDFVNIEQVICAKSYIPAMVIDFLVKKKLSILSQNTIERLVLIISRKHRYETNLKYLIEEAGLEFSQDIKDKALTCSAANNNDGIILFLASSSWTFSQGALDSALNRLIAKNFAGTIRNVLKKGNFDFPCDKMRTFLIVALNSNSFRCFKLILEKISLNLDQLVKSELLMLSLIPKKTKFLKLMLETFSFDNEVLISAHRKAIESSYTNAAEILQDYI